LAAADCRRGDPAVDAVFKFTGAPESIYIFTTVGAEPWGRYGSGAMELVAAALGEGFAIVELNGVTSEATHVYNPDGSLLVAWRTLMRQWSLAYAIGAANRNRGHRPVGIGRLARLLAAYWRRRPAHRLSD
jgi:hypothetical protein